jgi:hypothetical protein
MDVQKNINDGVYDTSRHYPTKTDRERELAAILNRPVKSLTADEMKNIVNLRHEFDELQTERRERMNFYSSEVNRLHLKFRADLEQEFNTRGHPKADLLFAKAWSHGHASGLSDVYYWYDELYELVAPTKD